MANGIANYYIWVAFAIFIVVALSIDGWILTSPRHRPSHSIRVALTWTFIWVIAALLFNCLLWIYLWQVKPAIANTTALNFLTGYIIEKSLSVDNLFVFYMVFNQLKIPQNYQQRVFTYGIWSAVVLRLMVILLSSWLVTTFHWLLYLMGAFLLLTGIKMVIVNEKEKDFSASYLYSWVKKYLRVSKEFHGNHFFFRKNKLWYATPLLVALIGIEISDIVFALDSIPAIFAITTDPFIVWTSNIFAILGLRALYFVLANMINRFHLLKYAIGIILVFVGIKMLIAPWYLIPVVYSLTFIVSVLTLFITLDLKRPG